MESPATSPTPAGWSTEIFTTDNSPPLAGHRTPAAADHRLSDSPIPALEDATLSGPQRREDEVALFARLVAGVLKNTIEEVRRGDDTSVSRLVATFQREFTAFRGDEENRLARLEQAIVNWKPAKIKTDPTTDFWFVYKKVADEYDKYLVSKYIGNLDTSLLFAGLFSAVTASFIVQIIPQLQPNPIDVTNALLLRILEQNTWFDGADPLKPVSNTPPGVVRAQPILVASLSVTLFVALIAALGKQWVLYYTRVTTWGNIVDRGKERQARLVGLQKWGLHVIMESLPVMSQLSLLLLSIALIIYLWDLDLSAAEVVMVVSLVALIFYICIAMAAAIWSDCPFQTPLSILLPKILPWGKELAATVRLPLRRWSRRRAAALLIQIGRVKDPNYLTNSLERVARTFTGWTNTHTDERARDNDYYMTLSDPSLWRQDPLFTSPIPKDIAASAGFWLLENSTDFSVATAVAAVFSEFQWPSHHNPFTALIRLHDTYRQCFRAPESNKSARLKALQSATAYYVLYHTQLIWSIWKSTEIETEKLPPNLPPDLFTYQYDDKWGGDVFEYLLQVEDRSEPVTSARFLSYIAPYWFFGDSDLTIQSRPDRLPTLHKLIKVLEKHRALNLATLTDCVVCAGAAVDFPLHPEDLIRVDKGGHFELAFKKVVEHAQWIASAPDHRPDCAKAALEVLLTLVKKATAPLVDAAWANQLLSNCITWDLGDDVFLLFLRLSARREEEYNTAEVGSQTGQDYVHVETSPRSPGGTASPETHTAEDPLMVKILRNIRTCDDQESSWQEEAVYGGLLAMRDVLQLESRVPGGDFLQTLSRLMENSNPFRVRVAAYEVILVVRDGWLKSEALYPTLKDLDIPRKLCGVAIETARPEYRRSFLALMETLSEEGYWHPYLRRAADIWLPLRHEGPDHVLRILTTVGELLLPGYNGSKLPLGRPLEKLVEDEWARVPGRPAHYLAPDRLKPLAEVTEQFKKLVLSESDSRAILCVVEQVIPSLERRCDDGYDGPGEDVRGIVDDLVGALRVPMEPARSRSAYDY